MLKIIFLIFYHMFPSKNVILCTCMYAGRIYSYFLDNNKNVHVLKILALKEIPACNIFSFEVTMGCGFNDEVAEKGLSRRRSKLQGTCTTECFILMPEDDNYRLFVYLH